MARVMTLAVISLATRVLANDGAPPVFKISAHSLYDAGLQQGRLAADRIKAWRHSEEMQKLVSWTEGGGKEDFEKMKRDNSAAFPQYVEEIKGIAEGSGLDLDSIWVLNLIEELESKMGLNPLNPPAPKHREGHCSDIYAVSAQGYSGGFYHGHNEDWSGVVKDLWYLVELFPQPGADFEQCGGLIYPGTLSAWAAAWNGHGIYMTQNTLFPRNSSVGGLGSVFMQREALCGKSGSRGVDAVVDAVTSHRWSDGGSVNIVDLRSRQMANIEIYEQDHVVTWVTAAMGNYSHFNNFKAYKPGVVDMPEPSSVHRQARVDQLPAPHSREDVIARLSDDSDTAYPIFRDMTIATLILDGSTGRLDVWCCGQRPNSGSPPFATFVLTPNFTTKLEEDATAMLFA